MSGHISAYNLAGPELTKTGTPVEDAERGSKGYITGLEMTREFSTIESTQLEYHFCLVLDRHIEISTCRDDDFSDQ